MLNNYIFKKMVTDYKDINYKNSKIINLRNPALFSQEALLELLDLYKEVDCNEDFKYTKDNKSSKKNIRTFCIHKFDKKTILPSEKKGFYHSYHLYPIRINFKKIK